MRSTRGRSSDRSSRILLPIGGETGCYYNVIRDNLVLSYHQYVYATEQYPE